MPAVQETIERVRRIDVDQYKYGFVTDIESDKAPKGLSEDIVRFISAKKGEPEWRLAWRLDAYKRWLPLREQKMLAGVVETNEDGEESAPRSRVAVDAVFDSVSVATTFQEELKKAGVIFMPMSEAIRNHTELVKK